MSVHSVGRNGICPPLSPNRFGASCCCEQGWKVTRPSYLPVTQLWPESQVWSAQRHESCWKCLPVLMKEHQVTVMVGGFGSWVKMLMSSCALCDACALASNLGRGQNARRMENTCVSC